MGWNSINVKSSFNLFEGVDLQPRFLFILSYYIKLNNDNCIMTTTSYGTDFVSGVNKTNICSSISPEKAIATE